MKKILLSLLLLVVACSISAQAWFSPELSQKMLHFFEKPDANALTESLKVLAQKQELSPEEADWAIAFFWEAANQGKNRSIIQTSLDQYKNTDLQKILNQAFSINLIEQYLKQTPNKRLNDMLWAGYFASGNPWYLDVILDQAVKYADEGKNLVLFNAGANAAWSLCFNAQNYPSIKQYLVDAKSRGYEEFITGLLSTDPLEYAKQKETFYAKQKAAGIW